MTAHKADLDTYVTAHRERLASVDSLLCPIPHSIEDSDIILTPQGVKDPDALGVLRTIKLAPDHPRAPWHTLTEHRMAFLFRTKREELDRTREAAELVMAEAEKALDKIATTDLNESFIVNLSAKDDVLAGPLLRHHMVPTVTTGLRRVSAAEELNPTYPIPVPAGVQLVGLEDVDPEEALAVALRGSQSDLLGKRVADHDAGTGALEKSLRGQIETGAELSSVAIRDGKIIGLSIAGRIGEAEGIRMDTGVRPMARCRLLWLERAERGSGIAHAMLRHTHGRIAEATIPWAISQFPTQVPMSAYFWYRQGYRPLTVEWQRTPVLTAKHK